MFQLSHTRNGFHVSFAATLENIDRVAQEAKKLLSTNHIEQHIFDVSLVLREGLMNAVINGSNLDAENRVALSLTLDDDILVIEIEDNGNGFDWRKRVGKIPTPESESGRGLAIMGLYCDSVQYNDKGNKVTLKKCIRSDFCQ
jgi:serine/threonine-protein kinase RsbW